MTADPVNEASSRAYSAALSEGGEPSTATVIFLGKTEVPVKVVSHSKGRPPKLRYKRIENPLTR